MNEIIKSFSKNHLNHLRSVKESILKGKVVKRNIFKGDNTIDLYDKYNENYNQSDKKKILKGDILVVQFLKFLYNIKGYDWFDYQLMLIPHFLIATLKTFYKSEWDIYAGRIKEQYEIDSVSKLVLSCASRRDGKTAAVSGWFAILLLLIKGTKDRPFQLIIASKDKDSSQNILNDVEAMIGRIKYDKSKIKVKKTADCINVYGYNEKNEKIIFSKILGFSRTGVSFCYFKTFIFTSLLNLFFFHLLFLEFFLL